MARWLQRAVWIVAALSANVLHADEGTEPALPPELAKLRQEIVELIGVPRCANLVNCRIAELGSRPCGGPAEYLTFNTFSADQTAIETKVSEYNFAFDDWLAKRRTAGACVKLQRPVAACVNARCVIPGAR